MDRKCVIFVAWIVLMRCYTSIFMCELMGQIILGFIQCMVEEYIYNDLFIRTKLGYECGNFYRRHLFPGNFFL